MTRRLHGDHGGAQADDLYHGIGIVFLAVCPLIGASVFYLASILNRSNTRAAVSILNGFAGGVLLGFGLLHALPDAASGIVSDYPYAYLIAGSTTLFLIFVSGLIEPLNNKFLNVHMPKELVNVNSLWCALLVHGCFEGLATGALVIHERWVVLGVLFVHKIVEYAALTAQMINAKLVPSVAAFWITLLTAEIPTLICFIVAWQTVQSEEVVGTSPVVPIDALFSALSAGTFLFLSLSHLVPDAVGTGVAHTHSWETNDFPAILGDEESGKEAQESAGKQGHLAERLLVLLSIGLGWTVFALFALSSDEHSHER